MIKRLVHYFKFTVLGLISLSPLTQVVPLKDVPRTLSAVRRCRRLNCAFISQLSVPVWFVWQGINSAGWGCWPVPGGVLAKGRGRAPLSQFEIRTVGIPERFETSVASGRMNTPESYTKEF